MTMRKNSDGLGRRGYENRRYHKNVCIVLQYGAADNSGVAEWMLDKEADRRDINGSNTADARAGTDSKCARTRFYNQTNKTWEGPPMETTSTSVDYGKQRKRRRKTRWAIGFRDDLLPLTA